MDIGVTIRNMGAESTADIIVTCAQAAEAQGMESLWITDHIAIPPDDAEGSGGRYLDTLTTLAWLGGTTGKIKLGSGVLILPYRPMLPTVKQIATLQELTKNRLILGVGTGWMDPEFKALGVDRHRRGRTTDNTLQFINECFSNDEVSLNGQTLTDKPSCSSLVLTNPLCSLAVEHRTHCIARLILQTAGSPWSVIRTSWQPASENIKELPTT